MESKPGNPDVRLLGKYPKAFENYKKKIRDMVLPWLKGKRPMTYRLACDRLNAKGITTFRGKTWNVSLLCQALRTNETEK